MKILEIVALVCLLCVVALYGRMFMLRGSGVVEGFTLDGGDYDDQYAKIYERVFNDSGYVKWNIGQIGETIGSGKSREEMGEDQETSGGQGSYRILEAGCGVGADTELLKKLVGKNLISVDRSAALMKIFKYNLPECQSKVGDLNVEELFKAGEFDIVTSLHNTLYHNTVGDMRAIIANFAKWLKSGGVLVLHMYDRGKLDPAPREFSQYYTSKKDGRRHSLTHFDAFIHDAFWSEEGNGDGTKGKSGEMIYNEKIVFRKTGNVKMMKHKLYFPDKDIIRAILKDNGFKFVKEIGMKGIGVDDAVLTIFKKA